MAKFKSDALSFQPSQANPFFGSETVDISSADHLFTVPMRGLLVTATGSVKLQYDGDESIQTIPMLVVSGGHYEFRGHLIRKIFKTGTTATILCGLK